MEYNCQLFLNRYLNKKVNYKYNEKSNNTMLLFDTRLSLNVILVNFGDKDFLVKQGNRIAQLVISPVLRPKILEVNSLSSSNRGSKGFGSTGLA
mgnify:CR=1 FL=1